MVVFGEEYHAQDVVYLKNPPSDLLNIAQITAIPRRDSGDHDSATVEVRVLRRKDKDVSPGLREAYIAQDVRFCLLNLNCFLSHPVDFTATPTPVIQD